MLKHSVQRNTQVCCARLQNQIKPEDLNKFVKRFEVQLRNLPVTYREILEDMDIYDIRNMFHDSDIPFRFQGCVKGNLTCCGTCMFKCPQRCPQDVLYRAYLLCGYLLDSPEDSFKERWDQSSMTAKMLYTEMTKEDPSYEKIRQTVENNFSIRTNTKLRNVMLNGEVLDNPNKYNYAPAFEFEEKYIKLPNGAIDVKYRPKADPANGEIAIHHWPRSGVCPFCLPYGTINRTRISGANRKSNRKKVKHDYRIDASNFEDED